MISLHVNGKKHEVDVEPDTPLMWVLRDNLGLTSVKYGCGIAECGACTVLVDGEPERSCILSVDGLENSEITTVEGLPEDHPVKVAWIREQVPQCGYCQPGMMLQAVGVLSSNPSPTVVQIAESMDDIVCRCGSHPRVVPAMELAAKMMKK